MITKYGVDHAAVQRLLDSGECATEEEAIEKVAHAQQREVGLNTSDTTTGHTQRSWKTRWTYRTAAYKPNKANDSQADYQPAAGVEDDGEVSNG